jgi:hypothetical protein
MVILSTVLAMAAPSLGSRVAPTDDAASQIWP